MKWLGVRTVGTQGVGIEDLHSMWLVPRQSVHLRALLPKRILWAQSHVNALIFIIFSNKLTWSYKRCRFPASGSLYWRNCVGERAVYRKTIAGFPDLKDRLFSTPSNGQKIIRAMKFIEIFSPLKISGVLGVTGVIGKMAVWMTAGVWRRETAASSGIWKLIPFSSKL